MSFILDALRKSESERRRENVPDITRIPLAPTGQELPRWVVPVTAGLGLAVVGLAAAWWLSLGPEASSAAREGVATSREAGTEPAPTRVARRTETDTAASREREIVPLGELAARPSPPEPATSGRTPSRSAPATGSPASRAGTESTAGAASTATAEPVGALPRRSDLLAEGLAIPELKLELHAYSETPAARFVFVNGGKYVEGDTLATGQEVVRVTREGVVLSHSGRRFLLLAE